MATETDETADKLTAAFDARYQRAINVKVAAAEAQYVTQIKILRQSVDELSRRLAALERKS